MHPTAAMPDPVHEPGAEPTAIGRLREEARSDSPEAWCRLGTALLEQDPRAHRAEAADWFARAANADYADGHFHLALYLHGEDDDEMAAFHMEAAAAQGYEPACALLEEWKLEGRAEFTDDEEAIRLLDAAAGRGSNRARCQLAVRITGGRGVEPDPVRVAALYRAAAEDGDAAGMHGLGTCYLHGYGVGPDEDEAMACFTAAAERDYADAWFALGALHRKAGRHGDSARCLARAAESDHAPAMFALAAAYGEGVGVEKNETKMRRLTLAAAGKGHAEAEYWAGTYYRSGVDGFPQDFARAVHWYERSAAQGFPQAIYQLGLHTLLGHGIEQDVNRGWELIEQAAGLEVVDAMMCMGTMIDSGQAPVDAPEEALNWYQRAADLGNADAQLIVGKRLMEIPNERRFAVDYLGKAAAQGSDEARELLDGLEAEASPPPPGPGDVLAAAVAGDPQAQYQLGFAHFMGMGAERNMELSYFWLSVVAQTMAPQAAPMLQMLETQVSADRRAAINAEAARWKPGTPPPPIG